MRAVDICGGLFHFANVACRPDSEQPKNMMFPTDAKLLNRARETLMRLAKGAASGCASPIHGWASSRRQASALCPRPSQFKRANRALKTLRTHLGRVIRNIARKMEGNASLGENAVFSESVLLRMLALARRVLDQKQRQRGPKV